MNSTGAYVAEIKPQEWPTADMPGNKRKMWCCKDLCTISTQNKITIKQGKVDIARAEILELNIDILGIGKLK